MRNWIIVLTALLVVGCAGFTANKATEVTVEAILALSGQVDLAEKRGYIDNDTEDRLQNRLIEGLRVLKSVRDVSLTAGCDESMTEQECVQVILLEVEAYLRENGL